MMQNLSDLLDEAIKSSLVKVANSEKEKQQQVTHAVGKTVKQDEVDDNRHSQTIIDEREKVVARGAIKLDDIIDQLNSIRAGHSFMKEPVASQIDQYLASLTKKERVVLLAFIKGISLIVTGSQPISYKSLLTTLAQSVKDGNDVRPAHIVEIINAVRSGHSFKDEEIISLLGEYVTALNQNQRVMLMTFLTGISKIAQGELPPAVTTEAVDEKDKLSQGDSITADDVVEKLNSIRSGKSFKDQTIQAAMKKYVGALNTAEKTALLAFLKGIAQITTGEVSADEAMEPEDNPAGISMQKSNEKTSKHIKPNVIKITATPEAEKKTPVEDTTPPAPIKAVKK
jgi:hypothetical protein